MKKLEFQEWKSETYKLTYSCLSRFLAACIFFNRSHRLYYITFMATPVKKLPAWKKTLCCPMLFASYRRSGFSAIEKWLLLGGVNCVKVLIFTHLLKFARDELMRQFNAKKLTKNCLPYKQPSSTANREVLIPKRQLLMSIKYFEVWPT